MAETPERKLDEKTGKEILVYPSGLIKEAKTGYTIMPGRANKIASSEQARDMAYKSHLARKEKQRDKIREEILRVTNESNIPDLERLTDSADAYSVGCGLVWQNAVLNPDSYPRDQIDGLKAIGEVGDFVPTRRESEEILMSRLAETFGVQSLDRDTLRQLTVIVLGFDRPNLNYPDVIDAEEESDA